MSQAPNAGAAAVPAPVQPLPELPPVAAAPARRNLREASWKSIRELFALDRQAIHLNTGTVGAMPYEVLETADAVTRQWTGGLADVYKPAGYFEQRTAIGQALGVDQDELMICHNATEGVARVIQGLDLKAGDEVITTSHECYSVLSNFNMVRNRYGVTVKTLTMPTGYDVQAEEIVERFEAAITPRTKVLAFAGVVLFTGTMMPMRKLCELAHRHGLITVIDGALLPGMLNLNMRAIGADFVACSGSKFQCGPLGTGILYLRNKVHPEHNPLPLPTFWPVISTWYPIIGSPPPRTSNRIASDDMALYLQSAGSASIARAAALAKACELWDEIGRDRIERYIFELAEHARGLLVEAFGEKAIYSPSADERLRSPLIAFNPFPDAADAWNIKKFMTFTQRLEAEHRIWIRWTEFDVPDSPHQHYAARVTTHLFNNRDELSKAVGIMSSLARELA